MAKLFPTNWMGRDRFIGSRPPKCIWYTRKNDLDEMSWQSDFLRIGWEEIDS